MEWISLQKISNWPFRCFIISYICALHVFRTLCLLLVVLFIGELFWLVVLIWFDCIFSVCKCPIGINRPWKPMVYVNVFSYIYKNMYSVYLCAYTHVYSGVHSCINALVHTYSFKCIRRILAPLCSLFDFSFLLTRNYVYIYIYIYIWRLIRQICYKKMRMERKTLINRWEKLFINISYSPPTRFDHYEWNYLRYEIRKISNNYCKFIISTQKMT